MFSRRPPARLVIVAVVLSAPLLAGCGWTPRDSFFRDRSVSFGASVGDGSYIAADQPARTTGDSRIGMADDR